MSATRGHFHFRRRTFRKASVFGKRAPFLRRFSEVKCHGVTCGSAMDQIMAAGFAPERRHSA
jgi:hypothetical protein